jgi:hypothetical protein
MLRKVYCLLQKSRHLNSLFIFTSIDTKFVTIRQVDVSQLAQIVILEIITKEVDRRLVFAYNILATSRNRLLLCAFWIVVARLTLNKGFHKLRVPYSHVDISI